ncbi:unnamed protein product [Dibothriocephalus latus]|uniref:Uncharacterized protein n=1 Tax=Dibothriocephalus latus TaxID=60516 RepID=A0A3P7NSF5_DIBLA|nr:unnamed protein product [Dibothriocephalus latus]
MAPTAPPPAQASADPLFNRLVDYLRCDGDDKLAAGGEDDHIVSALLSQLRITVLPPADSVVVGPAAAPEGSLIQSLGAAIELAVLMTGCHGETIPLFLAVMCF